MQTVLGIDVSGNLLYCAPGQVPQAIPLPKLPNTNWGKITSFALERGDLYVLDAESRALFNLYLQDIPSTQRLEISHTLNRSAAQIELIKKYINGRVRPSIASAKLQQSQYGLHSLMLHDIYSRLDQLQGDFDGVRKMVGPPLDKDIGSIPNMLQSSLTKVQDDLLEGIERLNGHKPDSETK